MNSKVRKLSKKKKIKAVPLQTWSGPEGSRNLRFPVFMTKAHVNLVIYANFKVVGLYFPARNKKFKILRWIV